MKWTCHDLDKRKEHYEKLTELLNLKLLIADKCLALFEEETIKNSNLLNDPVTTNLLEKINQALEEKVATERKRGAEETGGYDDDDDYEPDRKRSHKKKVGQIVESDYHRTSKILHTHISLLKLNIKKCLHSDISNRNGLQCFGLEGNLSK